MDISRVEFFCDDRKVGSVLRLLAGIALEVPQVTPVTNAVKRGKKLQQETSGDPLGLFREYIKKNKITVVTSSIGREFYKSIGKGGTHSYNYLFAKAREAGLLRKVGKGINTQWKVVQK
jgi:hypothetical protein